MPALGYVDLDAPPQQSFDPLPADTYTALITESDVKPTSKGDGERLALKFVVIEGEYENRTFFANINLRNPNPVCQQIGQSELAAIRAATGVNNPQASEEFHNIPIAVKLKIKPPSVDAKTGKQYGAQNEVKGYARLNDVPAPQQQAAALTRPAARPPATQPQRQTATPPASTVQPWKRQQTA